MRCWQLQIGAPNFSQLPTLPTPSGSDGVSHNESQQGVILRNHVQEIFNLIMMSIFCLFYESRLSCVHMAQTHGRLSTATKKKDGAWDVAPPSPPAAPQCPSMSVIASTFTAHSPQQNASTAPPLLLGAASRDTVMPSDALERARKRRAYL